MGSEFYKFLLPSFLFYLFFVIVSIFVFSYSNELRFYEWIVLRNVICVIISYHMWICQCSIKRLFPSVLYIIFYYELQKYHLCVSWFVLLVLQWSSQLYKHPIVGKLECCKILKVFGGRVSALDKYMIFLFRTWDTTDLGLALMT